jgi:predicted ATPase
VQVVARELCPNFDNDVQLVELASVSHPDLVPSAVAGVLGLRLANDAISPAALARAIGGRSLLLVLDNCEHVIDAAARCAEAILRQCGRTTILATSRELLRIEGEFAYRVAPLEIPPEGFQDVDTAGQHSAMALFLARIRASHADFALSKENLAFAVAICRRLDGIPLAIELAAARAATFGVEELFSRLDERFGFLTGGRRTAVPRHRTLRAMLDWSYDLLPNAERTILKRLAVFAGGFTLEAACAVVATPDTDARTIVDGIVNLIAKSLINVDPEAQRRRYGLLETVRAYALEKLAEAAEVGSTRLRHAQYFQALFQQAETERGNRPMADWLAVYGRDVDNVRTAIDWAFSTDEHASIAVELSADSISLMFDLSLVGEGHRRAEQALTAITSGVVVPKRREMQLLAVLQATRIYTDGPSDAGHAAWRRVLTIATEVGDPNYQARALWGLWNDHLYGGWPTLSLQFANRFRDLTGERFDPLGARTGAILGRRLLGTSLHYCGEQAAARPHLEHVLSHYVRNDHRWRVLGSRLDQAIVTRATLARVLWLQGYPDRALRLANLAVHDAIADDYLMSILYVLVEAAIPLSLFAGDFASAGRFLATLLEQAPRAGFRIWQTYGRSFHALLLVASQEPVTGTDRLIEAVHELEETGFCAHLTMFLGALAPAQAAAGRIADGIRTIDRGLDWAESHGEQWFTAELLRIKSDILLLGTAEANAAAPLSQALHLSRRQGARLWELHAMTSYARLLRRQGQYSQARAMLAPVYDGFTEGFETVGLRAARDLLQELPAV